MYEYILLAEEDLVCTPLLLTLPHFLIVHLQLDLAQPHGLDLAQSTPVPPQLAQHGALPVHLDHALALSLAYFH